MADDRTDPRQEQVRRLLGEARHDDPLPADVAARLDGVLDDLRAERPVAGPTAAVTDLGPRRRRRAVTALLAAAAVVVAGVGIGSLLDGEDSGADGDSASVADEPVAAAQDEARREGNARGTVGPEQEDGKGAFDGLKSELPTAATASPGKPPRPTTPTPVEVDPDRFAEDAVDLFATTRRRGAAARDDAPQEAGSPGTDWFVCPSANWGRGRLLAVHYEGQSAVLAYRAPVGDTRVVELLQCGTGTVLRSTTVPLP